MLFDLGVHHYLSRYATLAARLPIGTVRVEPSVGAPLYVSGFGDVELSASYELGRLWNVGGYRPSLRVRPLLLLPTGEAGRVRDVSADVPPNLVAIGNGAIGLGAELQLTQLLTRRWRGKAWLGMRAPVTYSEVDVRFGARVMGGVGAQVRAADWLLIDADATWTHRWHSRERGEGIMLNSGGDWLDGELRATVLASERVAVGASLRVPLYTDVNGQQVAQSVGVGVFGTLLFGLPDDEDEHGHGDDDHGHGDDEHGHGEDDHGHGDDAHGHGDESGQADAHGGEDAHAHHDAAEPAHHDDAPGGDVAVLASGGESFALAAAGVPGKLTVVDFWATWCKPCVEIEALLVRRAAADARVAVRKVEVPTFDTAVAREHLSAAKGLPTVWLIGADGAVIARLEMVAPAQLEAAIDEALAGMPAAE